MKKNWGELTTKGKARRINEYLIAKPNGIPERAWEQWNSYHDAKSTASETLKHEYLDKIRETIFNGRWFWI